MIKSLNTIPQNEKSYLNTFKTNKKLSVLIKECFFWLFSIYIKDILLNQIDNFPVDQIYLHFIKTNIIIDPIFKYENIKDSLNFNNGFFNDKKLILNSDELLERLLYVLKDKIKYDLYYIMNLHSKFYFQSYYLYTTDFYQYPHQFLFKGINSISNYLNYIKPTLLNNFQTFDFPYFIKNILFKNNIKLIQNNNYFNAALSVCDIWKYDNYNPGFNSITQIDDASFVFKYFKNEKLVKKISNPNDENINNLSQILGFKNITNNTNHYLSILDL